MLQEYDILHNAIVSCYLQVVEKSLEFIFKFLLKKSTKLCYFCLMHLVMPTSNCRIKVTISYGEHYYRSVTNGLELKNHENSQQKYQLGHLLHCFNYLNYKNNKLILITYIYTPE